MTRQVVLLNGAPAEKAGDALLALAQVNYGHFTSLQVRAGATRGLGLHLDRLQAGTAALFDTALDTATVRDWMRRAAADAGSDCSLRVTVFSRQFDHRQPLRAVTPDVLVAASAPAAAATRPLRVQVRHFLRPVPQLKHVGTFPLFHHRRLALQAGYDDALFADGGGADARVAEGSVWNIGFWDGAQVVWPEAPALRGTTEQLLQAGLAAGRVGQVVRPVAVADLPGFQAAFAANASGVQAIRAIGPVEYSDDRYAPLQAALDAAMARVPWDVL